jgi:hypothetical protein
MWPNFDGRAYTRDQFAARVASQTWTAWKPQGITLHNTSAPTLAQWVESGPKHDDRIKNLQSYYEGLGWHSGPHLFISRNFINGFANILATGVHASCFNSTHLGLEMAGDFDSEEFNTGDGALVRDNAVFAMAVLCRKLGLDPSKAINFHRECLKDNHACPGSKVSKPDIIYRVQRMMADLGGNPAPVAAPLPVSSPAPVKPSADAPVARLQQALADLGGNPGTIDGIVGPKTRAAAKAVLGI